MNVPSAASSIAPAAAPPTALWLSAGSAHLVSPRSPRAEAGAPADGFQTSANLPNVTYAPTNCPASGGRLPLVAAPAGRKPEPVTVMVSPARSMPAVFETVTVGAEGWAAAVYDTESGVVGLRASAAPPEEYQ
ncbi:MAG: hypothetical protein PGN24_08805 [Microbacterium arborescens]